MLDLLLMFSLIAILFFVGVGICKAFSKIASHVQEHPEAGKAIYEHVFLPLFGNKKESPAGEKPANPE